MLCPEINDGAVLEKTLNDLYDMQPSAHSVAVVPVGLTKYRDGLFPLRCLTKQEAGNAIDCIEKIEARSRNEFGGGFAYASDELYLLAGRELPKAERYDGFPQIENGVGLLRSFEEDFKAALPAKNPAKKKCCFDSASGVSAAPFMQRLFDEMKPYGIEINVHPIKNRYWGENVTVSGLITGGDLVAQLKGCLSGQALLLPQTMMRERDTTFLDGMELAELEKELEVSVLPMPAADGGEFVERLFEFINEEKVND